MGHLEAGECSSKTAVETAQPLNPKLVKGVDQLDFLAVMMRLLG